jgi:hypothetical protein
LRNHFEALGLRDARVLEGKSEKEKRECKKVEERSVLRAREREGESMRGREGVIEG